MDVAIKKPDKDLRHGRVSPRPTKNVSPDFSSRVEYSLFAAAELP